MPRFFYLAAVIRISLASADTCGASDACGSQDAPAEQEKMAASLLQVHKSLPAPMTTREPFVALEAEPATSVNASLSFMGVALHHTERLDQDPAPTSPDVKTARPQATAGEPDEVTFGIFCKSFLGATMKTNSWDIDFVLFLTWKDPRVVSLVPAGKKEVTLSLSQAKAQIWMPEVVVTNRAVKMYEIISTAVQIYSTGEVRKVERAMVTCKNIFDLGEYPFDTQDFYLKIASAKYMSDELVLNPSKDKNQSGVNEDIFDAFQYSLAGWKLYALEEQDGAMKTSRGVFHISGKRSLDKYGEAHLMPTVLLLIISFAIFWFPFLAPFIMPRMALSMLALLSFTNLMIKTSGMLPPGAPCNWNDIFNQLVLALMSSTIIFNIVAEVCEHQFKFDHLGQTINHEAKVLQPCHAIVLLTIVESAGAYKWISVRNAQVLCQVIFGTVFAGYVAYCFSRMHVHHHKKKKEAEA